MFGKDEVRAMRVPTEEDMEEEEESRSLATGSRARRDGPRVVLRVVQLSYVNVVVGLLALLVVLLLGIVIGGRAGVLAPAASGHRGGRSSVPLPGSDTKVWSDADSGSSGQAGGAQSVEDALREADAAAAEAAGGSGSQEQTRPPARFTKEKLAAARKEGTKLVKMLEDYYGPAKGTLKSAWNRDPVEGPDFKSGREAWVRMIGRALVDDNRKSFIIGTMGSSVAAGHDNCNYDNYQQQLTRTFGPVWEAAGLQLVVHNAGEGGSCGDSHRNQVFCVKQNLSPATDIIHYTWTYFEGKEPQKHHENLIRWAQMMPRQPPVNVWYTGGHDAYSCNVHGTKGPRIFEAYKNLGFNLLCLEGGLFQNGKYGGKKWGQVGDGLHNTTRYGEKETNKERQDSLGVVFRNWHPGPLGFQFVADAFAYAYVRALLVALDEIEAAWGRGEDARDTFPPPRPVLNSDLPEPILCDPLYCKVENPPDCLNFEEPHFGVNKIYSTYPDIEFNPHRGETQAWEVWHGEYHNLIPKVEQKLYGMTLSGSEINCGHADRCGGIEASSSDAGWLVLTLPRMDKGLIVLCGCCGKDVGKPMFIDNEALEMEFDGQVLDRSTFDIFPDKKCVRVMKTFPDDMKDSRGHAYLSLRLKPGVKATKVRISHVITL